MRENMASIIGDSSRMNATLAGIGSAPRSKSRRAAKGGFAMVDTPGTPSTVASYEVSAKEAFALMLETACEDFENLLNLIGGQLKVVAPEQNGTKSDNQEARQNAHRALRASARIQIALAKSFVFNAHRANRICQKNKAALILDRTERTLFLKATEPLKPVRNVNEHGFDGDGSAKPSMHRQEEGRLDETALVIDGREKILMGPLNLYTIYRSVERMRKIAGFNSLPGPDTAPSAACPAEYKAGQPFHPI
jgi:hypothetical protein